MTVFLDRDGTLIRDLGYLGDPRKIVILPGVIKGLQLLVGSGAALIGVSNQAAISRGLVTDVEVRSVNARLLQILAGHGIHFLDFYYCPHAPEDLCDCRKPKPGMGLRARQEHNLDGPFFMVGDKGDDVAFGRSIGASPILLPRGDGGSLIEGKEQNPFFQAIDFMRAAEWILKNA